MDPNATLRLLREIARDYRAADDGDGYADPMEYVHNLSQMVDVFDALDGWLTAGGFLPGAWQR